MGAWNFAERAWWLNAAIDCVGNPLEGKPEFRTLRDGVSCSLPKEDRVENLHRISRSAMTPDEVRAALFHNALLAKWRLGDASSARQRADEAMDGFISRNAAAKGTLVPYPYGYWMKRILGTWLPEPLAPVPTGRFGPGAVAEHLSHLRRFYRLLEWCDAEHWPEDPSALASSCDDVNHIAARLCAVPKDITKDRLITVEPTYSSFVQQYARSRLLQSIHEGPLCGSPFDLDYVDTPSIQRRLALKASKDKVYATVDLSDASDHISWEMVRQVFPSWVVSLLDTTRSERYIDPRHRVEGDLHIFAGMGNATTFVVETLFFGAAVKALLLAHGLHGRVSVFGDDIICPSGVVPLFEELSPALVINRRKTFYGDDGLRESCGIYAFHGVDVQFPDIRGYGPDWAGRLAVAELFTRLRLDYGGLFSRLADRIIEEGSLPVLPCYIPGYPALWSGDRKLPRSIPQRINHNYQYLELRLPFEEGRSEFLPADAECTRKFGYPPALPAALYVASLCGMVRLEHRERRARSYYGYIAPRPGRRTRLRWLRAEPLPDLPVLHQGPS